MNEQISQKLIGCRVKAARESMGWTQHRLSQGLGLNDRQTISDIENGKRNLKPEELLALSDLLEQDIEYFINPFAVVGEAQFSWRAAPKVPREILDGFTLKVGQWIGLLRWLREQQTTKVSVLKRALRLSSSPTFEEVGNCAENLAAELNLGLIPAENLISQIEKELDIPVLFLDDVESDDASSISGATCHLDAMGVILINRNEVEGRRNFNIAHELFHALTWDEMKPEYRESNSSERGGKGKHKRIELLADNFAAALLMPSDSLSKLIVKKRIGDVEHLSEIAAQLQVTPIAMAYRLLNLKWIDQDIFNRLSQKKQPPGTKIAPKPFSVTFIQLLHDALETGRISARKAAKALGLGLGGLTELFAQYDLHAPFEL